MKIDAHVTDLLHQLHLKMEVLQGEISFVKSCGNDLSKFPVAEYRKDLSELKDIIDLIDLALSGLDLENFARQR